MEELTGKLGERACAGTREDDAGQRERQREFGSVRRRAALNSSSARLRCGGSVSAKRSEQWPAVVQKQGRLQGQTTGLASASGGGWQVSTSAVTHTLPRVLGVVLRAPVSG